MAKQELDAMSIKNEINKNGFFIKHNLLKKETNHVYGEVKQIFHKYTNEKFSEKLIFDLFKKDFNGFIGCANACQNSTSIWRLATNQKIISTLKQAGLKHPIINTRPLLTFSHKDLAKKDVHWMVPIHQDWPSTQGSVNGITCWIPLIDIDDEIGPLEISPKTHLQGVLPFENHNGVPVLKNKKKYKLNKISMQKGDMLSFSWFTIHASGENRSNKIRLAVHIRYDDLEEETFKKRKYPVCRKDIRSDYELPKNWPPKRVVKQTYE